MKSHISNELLSSKNEIQKSYNSIHVNNLDPIGEMAVFFDWCSKTGEKLEKLVQDNHKKGGELFFGDSPVRALR